MSGDLSFERAWALVDELARAGVRLAVVSPGSRSTPLVLALDRHPAIDVVVHLDERGAAFVALGAAKGTGRPAVAACTSGTAAANYLPSVVEAAQSCVPLILLTADRPPWLRGSGANQTIDQRNLFGVYARWFEDLPVAATPAEWRACGQRAVAAAVASPPGPVQLNCPFDEPLVPETAPAPVVSDAMVAPAPEEVVPEVSQDAIGRVAELLSGGRTGVVLAGDARAPAPSVADLAATLRWPLLAEPTSAMRVPDAALQAGQWLVGDADFMGGAGPDVVLQVGARPTSRPAQSLVAQAEVKVSLEWPGRPASDRSFDVVGVGDPDAAARALVPAARAAAPEWLERWLGADARARAAVDGLLDRWTRPHEVRVARDLAACLPSGTTLLAGSSTPVRDLDLAMAPRRGLRVIGNRGASGIDGMVSTALGVAAATAARPDRPTVALLGDLTVLHDLGALAWSAPRGANVVFVMPNNDGGGIFDYLPVSQLPEHERLFVTPHRADVGAIARAAGVGYGTVVAAEDLAGAVTAAIQTGGIHLVEVAIDRAFARAGRAELRETVAAAIR